MIKIKFFHNGAKQLCGFEMSGHSGYAEHGYDIVCAAVSALAINTVNSIETLTDESVETEFEDEGGYLRITLPELIKGNVSKEALLLLQSFELGLVNIKNDYKKNIHISYKEV